MLRSLTLLSLAAAFSLANAQSPNPSDTTDPQATTQSQPAPIVRSFPPNRSTQYRQRFQHEQIVDSQPISGVWLRSESSSATKTITATPQRAEISLERGRLNVNVHHPADHTEILIDLPGGQVSLFKDGLYTLNADTNTVRVLRGEAAAYPGPISANANVKPIKVKEDHQLSLVAAPGLKPGDIRSVEAYPYELTADLLPLGNMADAGYGEDYAGDYPRYGEGWGYPGYYPGYYGYGYPFAYGIGFGYYGGFHGGYGFRGGFRR